MISRLHLLPAILAALGLAACGQPPSTPAGNETEPSPAASPEPSPSPTPEQASSLIPPPEPTPAPQPKILYVTTEFRAVSQLGTHEFPVGTEVELLEIEGDEYLVQKGDVAVRIHRTYFSETAPALPETAPALPETAPALPETAAAPSPTPDEIPLTPAPADPATLQPEPPATPAPLAPAQPPSELSPEERRISELTDSIREVDTRLREARESGSAAEIEQLRKRRDQLSEELTSYGKP